MKKYFIAFILLLLMPLKGGACVFHPSLEQIFLESEEIFTGSIEKISCNNNLVKIEYGVKNIWKGDINRSKIIYGKTCDPSKNIAVNKNYEYLVYAKLDRNKKILKFFSFSNCGGHTKVIRSNWQDWMKEQWLRFKAGFPMDWSISEKYGANYDLEKLGKPIYQFK